jgi:hypothetical protein
MYWRQVWLCNDASELPELGLPEEFRHFEFGFVPMGPKHRVFCGANRIKINVCVEIAQHGSSLIYQIS